MSHLLLAAALTLAAPEVEDHSSHTAAAESLSTSVQTGTLLFSRGECLAIRVATRGPYTHVAAVVVENERPYVYDSMNGSGVRRLTLHQYLRTQRPHELDVFQPTLAFSSKRADLFHAYLQEQIGRPYAVKHHVTGSQGEGLHCSEYVTEACIGCGMLTALRPSRVTPTTLSDGLIDGQLYVHERTLRIEPAPAVAPKSANWRQRLWFDTRDCSRRTWSKLSAWLVCK